MHCNSLTLSISLRVGVAILIVFMGSAATSQVSDSSVCNEMQAAVQDESFISNGIMSNLAVGEIDFAIDCALAGMRRNYGAVSNLKQNVQTEGVIEYNAFARAVRFLFDEYGYEAIGSFRASASLDDIHVIARGVRHPIRNLRINSGSILSNAIDNRHACVIIDQMFAVVEPSETDTPDINGRANLIYISRSLAKWSRTENWEAMTAAIAFIEMDISRSSTSELANLNQTRDALDDLKQRLADNRSSDVTRAPSFNGTNQTFYSQAMRNADRNACATFDGYEFVDNWNPSEFY